MRDIPQSYLVFERITQMTNMQIDVTNHVLMDCMGAVTVSEERIRFLVDFYSQIYPLSIDEKEAIIPILHSKLALKMDRGGFIKDESHKPWYFLAKKDLKMSFWERYRIYLLTKGYAPSVMDELDRSTDEMLDLLGNPKSDSGFQRRGLVIGDVQSGKTGTYIALINKAADAGYKVIILLTGTIEKLRRQTQERIDKGFVGLDSSALIRDKDSVLVGVGKIDASIQGFVLTSTTSDFNKATATKLNCKLTSIHDPVLFVIKKNKSVLEKLEQWLKVYNAKDGLIDEPMLLIDDEADNASINTRKDDEEPTIISSTIQRLLALFKMANYVGFTATPFANIFIDPDKSDEEVLTDGLFPRHFIYALETPPNYIGARGLFSDPISSENDTDGKFSYMLHDNQDCEAFVPEKHHKGFIPNAIPDSLDYALASFFIINAIRDLRGQIYSHRSMLINISRFIDVQEQISKIINGKVRELQREIKNYSKLGSKAMSLESFHLLRKTFDLYFSDIEFTWETIQDRISDSVQSIVVRSVNSGNAAKNLDYDDWEESGLRLIAIGGFSLSRGLTLEGLSVSYFYRNSKMYDTLMQMGRWFGYREGYADLCQVWMSNDSIIWYRQISAATDELRREVYRMQNANKTPEDFGLRVRSDLNILLVTARNKMRSAKDYEMTVTLSGEVIETQFLSSDSIRSKHNTLLLDSWLRDLQSTGYLFKDHYDDGYAIHALQTFNVPKQRIVELLSVFYSHQLNFSFSPERLIDLIDQTLDGSLDLWDVSIATGVATPVPNYGGFDEIRPVERSFEIKQLSKAIQMSKGASHLSSRGLAKTGLTKKKAEEIESEYRKSSQLSPDKVMSQNAWFKTGIKRNPILVIYPVSLGSSEIEEEKKAQKEHFISSFQIPLIGLSIGIPTISGCQSSRVRYKINKVMYRELLEISNDYEEEIGD